MSITAVGDHWRYTSNTGAESDFTVASAVEDDGPASVVSLTNDKTGGTAWVTKKWLREAPGHRTGHWEKVA